MRVYRRGKIFWGEYYQDGKRVQRSTRCHDKAAAEKVVRGWENRAADPALAAQEEATVGEALQYLVDEREAQAKAGKRSHDTAAFYRKKAGQLLRVFEYATGTHRPFLLHRLRSSHVDDYIEQRRTEGASESTISKELIALRASLRIAKRKGLLSAQIEALLPIGFAPEYKPRERALTREEAHALIAELLPDRAARVAFALATSACLRETELALRVDVSGDRVLLRGTKRSSRRRVVPLVTDWQKEFIAYAVRHAEGEGGALFKPWKNITRDLQVGCNLARIPPCTSNDLRRTCATWLRAQGLPPDLIAAILGHRDTRMVERVYGRLSPEMLAERMRLALGIATGHDCNTGVTDEGDETGQKRQMRRSEYGEGDDTKRGNPAPHETARGVERVPRDGVEPPTRGFSVPSPEIPEPRYESKNGPYRGTTVTPVSQLVPVRTPIKPARAASRVATGG